MTRPQRSLALLCCTLFLLATSASISAQRGIGVGLAHAPGVNQVAHVDCDQGESLQAAIDAAPGNREQITIEIQGFCQEQITISRQVVIRGVDPQSDGIAGPEIGNNTALVVVFGVNGFGRAGAETVRLEHLTVKDSSNIGVSANATQLGLSDVTIRNNGNIGLAAFQASSVAATNLTAMDNAGSGLFSRGSLSCTNCSLSGNGTNGGPAIGSDQAGKLLLFDTTATGTSGLQASSGGEITVNGGAITAIQRAISVLNGGHVFVQNGTQVSGSIFCSTQGILDSRRGVTAAGLTQVATGGPGNAINNGCVFAAGPGTTTLVGATNIAAGGLVATDNAPPNTITLKFGALNCLTGGKVTGATITVNNVPGIPASCGT